MVVVVGDHPRLHTLAAPADTYSSTPCHDDTRNFCSWSPPNPSSNHLHRSEHQSFSLLNTSGREEQAGRLSVALHQLEDGACGTLSAHPKQKFVIEFVARLSSRFPLSVNTQRADESLPPRCSMNVPELLRTLSFSSASSTGQSSPFVTNRKRRRGRKTCYTSYLLQVADESGSVSWCFQRRYSEFRALRQELLLLNRSVTKCSHCKEFFQDLRSKKFPSRLRFGSSEQLRTAQLYSFTVHLLSALQRTHARLDHMEREGRKDRLCAVMLTVLNFFAATCPTCHLKVVGNYGRRSSSHSEEFELGPTGDDKYNRERESYCTLCRINDGALSRTSPLRPESDFSCHHADLRVCRQSSCSSTLSNTNSLKQEILGRYLESLPAFGVTRMVKLSFPKVKSFDLYLGESPEGSALMAEMGLIKSVSNTSLASFAATASVSSASFAESSATSFSAGMKKSSSSTSFTSSLSSSSSSSSSGTFRPPPSIPQRSFSRAYTGSCVSSDRPKHATNRTLST